MTNNLKHQCPVLFGKADNAVSRLAKNIANIEVGELTKEYNFAKDNAPVRSQRDKKFFVGHDGVPSTQGKTNRTEEHYAIALSNLKNLNFNHRQITLLDYQVPLKARQRDAGVGKIDLLGAINQQLVIIELKVGSNTDTPLTALLEGLRYAAILSRKENMAALIKEVKHCFGAVVENKEPIIWLLASECWWNNWCRHERQYPWAKGFFKLIQDIESKIGLNVQCLFLEEVGISYGGNSQPPQLSKKPNLMEIKVGV